MKLSKNTKVSGNCIYVNGRFTRVKEALAAQAKKVLYILRKIAKTSIFPPLSVMCKLFDTIVLPVLYYGAEVWGMVKSEEIEKIQFQFCKFILQVPTRAPTAAVMAGLR